jgi:hypothetical protein
LFWCIDPGPSSQRSPKISSFEIYDCKLTEQYSDLIHKENHFICPPLNWQRENGFQYRTAWWSSYREPWSWRVIVKWLEWKRMGRTNGVFLRQPNGNITVA